MSDFRRSLIASQSSGALVSVSDAGEFTNHYIKPDKSTYRGSGDVFLDIHGRLWRPPFTTPVATTRFKSINFDDSRIAFHYCIDLHGRFWKRDMGNILTMWFPAISWKHIYTNFYSGVNDPSTAGDPRPRWWHGIDIDGNLWQWSNETDIMQIGDKKWTELFIVTKYSAEANVNDIGQYIYGNTTDGKLWLWNTNDGYSSIVHFADLNVKKLYSWSEYPQEGYTSIFCISDTGHLYSWGYNYFGSLGLGDTEDRATPTRVGDNTWESIVFEDVAAGRSWAYPYCDLRIFALDASGKLWCWGNDEQSPSDADCIYRLPVVRDDSLIVKEISHADYIISPAPVLGDIVWKGNISSVMFSNRFIDDIYPYNNILYGFGVDGTLYTWGLIPMLSPSKTVIGGENPTPCDANIKVKQLRNITGSWISFIGEDGYIYSRSITKKTIGWVDSGWKTLNTVPCVLASGDMFIDRQGYLYKGLDSTTPLNSSRKISGFFSTINDVRYVIQK